MTFSGGEPLAQPNFLFELASEAKQRHLHTAIETSGYARWEVFRPILEYLDLVLYDLKLMDAEAFAASLANLDGLDILPYHRMGEPKWGQLGQSYVLHGLAPHKKEKPDEIVAMAREYGIEVTLGG